MTTTESSAVADAVEVPFQEHIVIGAHDLAELLGSSARPTQVWVEPGSLWVHIQGEAPDAGDARTRYRRYRVAPGSEVDRSSVTTRALAVDGDEAELDEAVLAVTRACNRVSIEREPGVVRFTVLSASESGLVADALRPLHLKALSALGLSWPDLDDAAASLPSA